MSTEPESSRTDKSRDELPSKIAGIPVSEFKAALKELRVSKGADEWAQMNARHFTKSMEKSFKLEEGKLKHIDLSLLIDQAEDEHREEEKKEKARKRREEEKKKKEDEEKEKEEKEQTSSSKKTADPKVTKRRRDNSPDRASKKTKRHSHSSEGSDSERKRKSKSSKSNRHKKMKRDFDDPTVQKIERLKKIIRGCGVPITGFHKDMSNDRTLRKLQQIIQEYEKDGMKEKMVRSEMLKVRASIEAQREVDELRRIPKKLQISGKHPRKVTRKKVGPKYDLDLEKASSSGSETPSETHSNYSSGEAD